MLRALARLPRIWRRDHFDEALSYAVSIAGTGGIDSLDLLAGVLATSPRARRLVSAGGSDLQADIRSAVPWPDWRPRSPEPGLTEEAKRVLDAVSARALSKRQNPTAVDLLVALTMADSAARELLGAHGVRRESLPD